MYNTFFGFKERPFKLVPNPAYLFLSKIHEEALAHLIYAISHGDGFVEITGEVGTGKTTLCRAFLDNLNEKTEAAYIFNPKLDAIQLVKTINDEFGIDSSGDNIKELIDSLNSFLMMKRAEGETIILLIDEAQNLTKEVLEQLRLLSNLETNTKKLLQIILVGQPELSEMLNSYELRQLGQRITLSCRLTPLTFKETKEYIEHRLHVASSKSVVQFTGRAFRILHKYSGGVPRLINIACDRTLLTAYGYNKHKITGELAKESIKELRERDGIKSSLFGGRRIGWLLVPGGICFLLLLTFLLFPDQVRRHVKTATEEVSQKIGYPRPEPIENINLNPSSYEKDDGTSGQTTNLVDAAGAANTIVDLPDEDSGSANGDEKSGITLPRQTEEQKVIMGLGEYIQTFPVTPSRVKALILAMELWGEEVAIMDNVEVENDHIFFQQAVDKYDFYVRRFEGNLHLLKNINLPAILQFRLTPDSFPVYLTLSTIKTDSVILRGGRDNIAIQVEPNDLKMYWTGIAFIPWRDFSGIVDTVPINSSSRSIVTLKRLLKKIGFTEIDETPYYDVNTTEAVVAIQKKYGINVDGIVGPSTKIALYNESKTLPIPHITEK